MRDETNPRWVYLVGFPLVTIGLCLFSYWLGTQRVGQLNQAPAHEEGKELTFFKDLKEKESPKVPPPPVLEKTIESGFAVQVSAFRDVGKAHELVDELSTKGFHAFTPSGNLKPDEWYRVYVGPYETKEKADGAMTSLKNEGYKNGFVAKIDVH